MRLISVPEERQPWSAIVVCGIQNYNNEKTAVPGCGNTYKLTAEDIFSINVQGNKFLKVNCWRCEFCRKTHSLQIAESLSVPEEREWLRKKKMTIVKALLKYSTLEELSDEFLLTDEFVSQL